MATTRKKSPAFTTGNWIPYYHASKRRWSVHAVHEIFEHELAQVLYKGNEAEANARLMAGSKALLEACEQLLECLSGWMEIADEGDMRKYDQEAMQKGQQAVAQARGITE